METLDLNGKTFKAHKINLYGASLLIIEGKLGFLACGYINLQTAQKLSHAAAIVTGVKDFHDMLSAKVVAVSSAAEALGVEEGMSGEEALGLLA
jgi:uncharacterized protein YunC (DUF1805 family)